ncbi:NAD(P)-dependent oxidoreductase [Amycolatopsis sp. cg13]|uniref:NAD(P)-dependent oxidoreductase n=1 Tax=Amycolatopsis sp. cg13 TaxID=3238807 RepID=UPI0035267E00
MRSGSERAGDRPEPPAHRAGFRPRFGTAGVQGSRRYRRAHGVRTAKQPGRGFRAGGRAGLAIVAKALRRGRPVLGVVRDPARHSALAALGEGVTVVAGDLTDSDSVTAVLPDEVAALVNAVTPFTAPPESFENFDPDYYVRLVENLAKAARGSRVIEIGLAAWQEQAAMDWLVVTPPPGLSLEAPTTGEYRIAGDVLDSQAAAIPLSYADLATAVLDQIDQPTMSRQQVTVYR